MIEAEAQVREWGGSLGIVLPKESADRESVKAGDTVKFVLVKRSNALRETFGTVKLRRSTDDILKEIDETGWNE